MSDCSASCVAVNGSIVVSMRKYCPEPLHVSTAVCACPGVNTIIACMLADSNTLAIKTAVSMQIPLFNKLNYRTAKNQTRNNMAITELDNELTMQQLQTEIKQVVDNCRGLSKEYDQADKQVEANTLAHKAIQRKYDEGLLSAIELQTSANRLQEARSNLLRIKLDYIINYRLIRYYQGVPLIDQIHNSR